MPRPRKRENQALPRRWRHIHGAYYYSVPPGLEHQWDNKKLFRLGSKLHEAYQVWATRLGEQADVRTIGCWRRPKIDPLVRIVPTEI